MMVTALNIWLTLDSKKTGGIETHVLHLAIGLKKSGHKVHIFFIKNHGNHPLLPLFKKHNISVMALNGHFISLIKHIKYGQPDLIHSHGYKAGISCRIASLITRTPHISTYHAGEKNHGKLAFYDWLDRMSAPLNSLSFSVSQKISQRIASKNIVLDNFISIPTLVPKTHHKIAFVGRLSFEKGPDQLIYIAQHKPHIQFHFYGTGPMHDSLKSNAPSNCFFYGEQNNMNDVWPQIDLLLMPSRFEGLPMTALEAMARKIPLIAFNVGALKKVIDNAQNGWLIQQENVDEFSQRIEEWLQLSPKHKNIMRHHAKTKINQCFSDAKIIPQILKYYQISIEDKHSNCNANCK